MSNGPTEERAIESRRLGVRRDHVAARGAMRQGPMTNVMYRQRRRDVAGGDHSRRGRAARSLPMGHAAATQG